jgi:hypothetical protein
MNDQPQSPANFREGIAKWIAISVVGSTAILAALGITLGIIHLYRTPGPEGVDNAKDILQFIFSALLPLWGTWIGTVLAYYFSKENFESANKQVRELVSQVTGTERLKSLKVTEVMMPFDKIKREDVPASGNPEALLITNLYQNVLTKQVRRALIFQGHKVIYSLHKSLLSDYLFRNATSNLLTIVNMKEDLDKDIQNAFNNGVQVVSKNTTLLDVKNIMDLIPGCQDVFVTESGKRDEDVLGWISNVDVMNNSKA